MSKVLYKHGGEIIANILQSHNVKWIFTLCGGHISPILTGCNELGIKVVDVRNESTAVFAADGLFRLNGNIGIAAVTAGPGLTNTITAIKNAQLAQTSILIIGGATATVLKNRGSLQDIDHMSVVDSITKYANTITRLRDIRPIMEEAISMALNGVPGPVYLELPVDVLYPEAIVRDWYGLKSKSKSLPLWMSYYLKWNVNRIFKNKDKPYKRKNYLESKQNYDAHILYLNDIISKSKKPVIIIGSQACSRLFDNKLFLNGLKKINIPIYVSGMARGLLSDKSLPIYRYERKKVLKESDLVILAGVPCDFRLDYGRAINNKAKIISINLSRADLYLNRKPHRGILLHPGKVLIKLSTSIVKSNIEKWKNWHKKIKDMNKKKLESIQNLSKKNVNFVNPIKLFLEINQHINQGDIIIADGGDFVSTASYILQPRRFNGWLDPGVFGTLGVGAGFILSSQLVVKDSVVWAIFGDGSFGYSLIEFDTFVRHKIPVLAIIGNDASWSQIARDQLKILKNPISTKLSYTNYHEAVEGLGGKGFLVDHHDQINDTIVEAKEFVKRGVPTVINVKIGKTDFREGSISI